MQAGRQTGRQADRQTETNRQTDIDREGETARHREHSIVPEALHCRY